MNDYPPLLRPCDPKDTALSRTGKIFAAIPILGWSWAATCWDSRWRPPFNRLKEQLKARQPPPAAMWGDNCRRRELAAFIAEKIKDAFGWPNDFFIPEDSFWVMMFPPQDDLCGVEVMMDIEDRLERPLSEPEVIRMGEMKFGDVVDFLLEIAGKDPIPLVGPEAVEARPCASASVFWQLRTFALTHAGIPRPVFRPQARLRDLFRLGEEQMRSVSIFVARRFGVSQPARRMFLGFLPPFWSWLSLYALAAVAIRVLIKPLFWWYIVLAPLPLGIILSLLATWTWEKRLHTVADLVRWTLQERRKRRNRIYGSSDAGGSR